ncbi:hypothetical protein ACRAWF_41210 [Streptomyces sp. L7]
MWGGGHPAGGVPAGVPRLGAAGTVHRSHRPRHDEQPPSWWPLWSSPPSAGAARSSRGRSRGSWRIPSTADALPLLAYPCCGSSISRLGDSEIATKASYLALGGVTGALARQADEVFATVVDEHGADTAPTALLLLVGTEAWPRELRSNAGFPTAELPASPSGRDPAAPLRRGPAAGGHQSRTTRPRSRSRPR